MNFQSITVHCTNLTETETNWSAAAAGSHMKHAPAQLITAQPQLDLLLEGTKPSLAAIAMNAGQYFLGVDFFNNLIFLEFLKLINLTTWFFSVTWRLLLTSLQIYQEAINCYTSRYPAFRATHRAILYNCKINANIQDVYHRPNLERASNDVTTLVLVQVIKNRRASLCNNIPRILAIIYTSCRNQSFN